MVALLESEARRPSPPRPVAEFAEPAGSSWQPSTRALRILVAEDNPVNQKLAIQVLEKLGHTVTLANNGREAVEAEAREAFDAILMDLQMPELNGLEATEQIREDERATRRHVPIVAMTAHALKGDRERCLRAGMDHYLSKPIRIEELRQIIASLSQSGSGGPSAAQPASDILDLSHALAQVEGEASVLRELSMLFLQEGSNNVAGLQDAVARRDQESMEREVGTLEDSLRIFGATSALRALQAVAACGRTAGMAGAEDAVGALVTELGRLQSALGALVGPCPV
jgi:CheY-like chemotaxis protein